MKASFHLRAAGTAAALLFAAYSVGAATLYDPGLNSLPSSQGWLTLGTPGYTESVGGGVYTLNTTAANAIQVGSSLFNVPTLDTVTGFKLDFNLRIASEAHDRPERAGFSVIVTGLDPAHAVEIAFWSDHVWAYTGSFAHGVDAAFNTTTKQHAYSLVVKNNDYEFAADGSTLFSGALISLAAGGPVYAQSGLVFFGDDTTSAQSSSELRGVTLAAIPEPATGALLVAGLAVLAGVRRRIGTVH